MGLSITSGIKIGNSISECNNRVYNDEHARLTNLASEGRLAYQEELSCLERKWGPNSFKGTMGPKILYSTFGLLIGSFIVGFGCMAKNYEGPVGAGTQDSLGGQRDSSKDDPGCFGPGGLKY